MMAPQTPQQGASELESSRTTGVSTNMPPPQTQLWCRHDIVHRDTANATTEPMPLDAQLQIVRKTGSSRNWMQHRITFIHCCIKADCNQQMIQHTAGVPTELRDQLIAACNGKPPWSTKAFAYTVRQITHHDVFSPGMFLDQFRDEHPREWTKQASTILDDATEACMVEAIAKSDM